MELPLSELELELNCLLDWVPDSELEWNCLYRNWNWNWKNGIDPSSGLHTNRAGANRLSFKGGTDTAALYNIL